MERFSKENFRQICDLLSQKDKHLQQIIDAYGHPPLWIRANTFATLVLTILEQQVSLASAFAAFKKIKEKTGVVTPGNLLRLSDAELRNCYFSRQKIIYTRELANAINNSDISLRKFHHLPDDHVRTELKKLKGIGDWTVDIYLLHALKRTDIFPIGDLALVNAIKEIKQLPSGTTKDRLIEIAESWRPYRSIATMILWHHYIKKRKIKVAH